MAEAMRDITAYLSYEQIQAMIESEPYLMNKLLIQMTFRTGLRISEVLSIDVEDVRWDDRVLLVRRLKKNSWRWKPGNDTSNRLCPCCGDLVPIESLIEHRESHTEFYAAKPGKQSKKGLPIDTGTLEMLKEYLERSGIKSGCIFPGRKDSTHLHRVTAYLYIRQAAERIGITEVGDPDISKYRHPHAHTLRHSLARHYMKSSEGRIEDLAMLQRQLGHAAITTTMIYLSFSEKESHQAYDRLWER